LGGVPWPRVVRPGTLLSGRGFVAPSCDSAVEPFSHLAQRVQGRWVNDCGEHPHPHFARFKPRIGRRMRMLDTSRIKEEAPFPPPSPARGYEGKQLVLSSCFSHFGAGPLLPSPKGKGAPPRFLEESVKKRGFQWSSSGSGRTGGPEDGWDSPGTGGGAFSGAGMGMYRQPGAGDFEPPRRPLERHVRSPRYK